VPCPALTLRDAVVAAIVGGGVSGLSVTNVKHRKRPERLPSDPERLCVVVLGPERHVNRDNVTVNVAYPALVVLSRKLSLTVTQSDGWEEETRYALWRLLFRQQILGPNGGFLRCEYDSSPAFDRDGFEQGYDVSGQLFTYYADLVSPD
jgi:hypothetical protein